MVVWMLSKTLNVISWQHCARPFIIIFVVITMMLKVMTACLDVVVLQWSGRHDDGVLMYR